MLGNSCTSWKSKKQLTVSLEAEYRVMSGAASEVTWLVTFLLALNVHINKPITLFCDKQSAIFIGKKPGFHERTKHIDVDCHFTREKGSGRLITIIIVTFVFF